MTTDRIRPAKLAEAIAAHIETLILEGSLRPGDRLLAERDLALKLDVSRPSLREALEILERRGTLEGGRGGAVVAPVLGKAFSDGLMALIANDQDSGYDYLEFRGVVEGKAAYLATLRGTGVDREIIANRFQIMEGAHSDLEPSAEARADAAFHLAIYEASHNIMMLHVMSSLAALMHQDVFYNRNKLYARKGVRGLLLEQHRAIHDAIMGGDPETARAAAEAHVAFTRCALQEIDQADARLEVSLRRFIDDPPGQH